MQKVLLQIVVFVLSLIPIGSGAKDIWKGLYKYNLSAEEIRKLSDSDFRFSSGIWFMLGLCTLYIIPRIEKEKKLFRFIILMIMTGGIGRIVSIAYSGRIVTTDIINLCLELLISPMLILWQNRLKESVGEAQG